MWKRSTGLVLLVGVVALIQSGAAYGAFDPIGDPDLVAWWSFDEGEGNTAADSSPNGNDGTLTGGATWVPGRFGGGINLDGTTGYVSIPNFSLTTNAITFVTWLNGWRGGDWAPFISSRAVNPCEMNFGDNNTLHYTWNNDAAATWSWTGGPVVPQDSWTMLAVTVAPDKAVAYVYTDAGGLLQSTNAIAHIQQTVGALQIGYSYSPRCVRGILDEVAVYKRALTQEEILILTKGPQDPAMAGKPTPSDGATDVPQDVTLSWAPGETATAHDVYFGTTFDDVNDASLATAAAQGQAATTFSPGLLELGQTCYWRVDETGADGTIFKGSVWSFTVEPFSYPIAGIKATASSVSGPKTGPEKTVDGSGLDPVTLLHSALDSDMWTSKGIKPNWIQYEFDKPYKIEKLLVWNSNQPMEGYIGFGAKDVTIEYSTDGVSWTVLENVPQFTQASGLEPCAADTIDFGGVVAKYVKLTITTNWGGFSPAVCLSEVKFYQIPVQAREPQPADDATDVALDAQMNWRPGREATSHQVFFATDSNAVAEGLAPASTVTDHRYTPAPMDFGTTYYWKVDEIGASGTYEGDLWSFTSREFALIEDFESYNDDDNCIFDTWLDGYDGSSGSIVGYMDSANGTFGETTILHGGAQSMPLAYDNSGPAFFSETTREFNPAQNWTGSGATELCVWTRGYPALAPVAVTETAGKMTLTGSGRDIWDNDDQFTYAFKTLTGDGTLVARVVSTGTGTSTWGKGGVMIRDSLHGNSAHAMMAITTPGVNGASFQYRDTTGGTSAGTDSGAVVTVPAWVKIERSGDTFNGYTSADGKAWTIVSSATIVMEAPVQIGLCVTSHAAGEERTFEFESIATTGAVTGVWQGVAISSPLHNDPVDMYLTVEDSTGKKATATSATAVTVADWTRWTIPMSDLAPVSFSKVKKLTLGVGTKGASTPGPTGMVFIDDIGFGTSAEGQ